MKDYDQIAYEIFQVFLIRLLLNMLMKFSSRDAVKRRDSFFSAKLLAYIANEFLDHNKPHYKQIRLSLKQVSQLYNDQGGRENKFVSEEEISNFRDLIEKPLEGKILLSNEKVPEEIT